MVDFSLSDEHKALIETAKRFARERIAPVAAACDHESRFPTEGMAAAHDLGLVNITGPPAYARAAAVSVGHQVGLDALQRRGP